MASTIKKGVKELCAEAERQIETMSVEQVMAAAKDPKVQLVDIRDIRELWREGGIPGAYHAPRGMLEFWVDPNSPYAKEMFQADKKFIFFCAGGMRSALAAKSVHDMGLAPVAHMAGGFGAWREKGGTIIPIEQKPPGEAKKKA